MAHVAVSADGATTGFQPDVTRFYRLAQTWKEDLTLAGADAVLAQEQALAGGDLSGPAPGGPCRPSWTAAAGSAGGRRCARPGWWTRSACSTRAWPASMPPASGKATAPPPRPSP
ncbi:hypothetical protein HD597_001545 [Nonomuraea thailandensis]|uniref:Uncharacterized protein n=1 Tax=Nonomuraea thailandensis TaxID=1188745 RepID=A0A9X2GB75_9ACTN|nr:hypothetical protein [Nonomuraea thailandensis]MCP2354525.1 hypothetical protein [Nonomuraea thailandensis]